MLWDRISPKAKLAGAALAPPVPGWFPDRAIAAVDQRSLALADLTRMAALSRAPDRLVEYVGEIIADQLAVKFVGVATREECSGNLIFRGGRGWSPELRPGMRVSTQSRSPGDAMFALAKAIVIEDLRAEKRFSLPRGLLAQGPISGMIAPLAHEARPFGLIGAFSSTRRGFDSTESDFFQAAANILSVALENDRLRGKLAQATEAVRREAAVKTAFIANASHEIRSPLNVILGYWELISERLGEVGDPSLPAWIDAVERSASRLVGTVDDILDFSRLESGAVQIKTETLRIASLVESVVRTAAPIAASKKIGLSCAIDAPDLTVRADRRSLEVALTKLVGNAIKFTDHGAVSIRLAREADRNAHLEISDSGVGIAADYIPHLFEPFSQESSHYARPFEGIGLGLAIAHHYLELNGAQIAVRSAKGHGTTFTIRLPRVQSARSSSVERSDVMTEAARPARHPAR